MSAILYLFPNSLGDTSLNKIIPEDNIRLISEIKYFIVEDVRTARRFLKKCNPAIVIDDLKFFILNQHTPAIEIQSFINPLLEGHDMGIISEAGCPAVADPGSDIVGLAMSKNIRVVPLVGPSSILLALMGSGFNGQSFTFNGYLPIQPEAFTKSIKKMEQRIYTENQTQIFIETPYRNMKTLAELIKNCRPETKLCIAADLTLASEFIKTKSISGWKNKFPELSKRPAIFLLYK